MGVIEGDLQVPGIDVDVILENCTITFVIREYLHVGTSCQGSIG